MLLDPVRLWLRLCWIGLQELLDPVRLWLHLCWIGFQELLDPVRRRLRLCWMLASWIRRWRSRAAIRESVLWYGHCISQQN